jgi:eukaryotic-like serine/threonine-protein kinase
MICPSCNAENAEGALTCARCCVVLPSLSESETLLDPDATGETHLDPGATTAVRSPVPGKPATAAAVLSPAPGSAGGSTPAGSSPSTPSWLTGILEPGMDFGPRYRIESVLGRGGMGAVYKAYDKDLDRMVALKLVRPDLTNDPEVMQRFKQELLLASKISHKNVLRIHDLGDVNGLKFISMAYVEGEDLHKILQKHGRLPVDEAVDLARQLCAALAAAHAEDVVHRDLKPQNVLIDQEGTAYISDFGLAKSLEAGAAMMTRAGELLGTPRYMSPEQVEGKPTDHRTDLYALGLIIYEMLTGDTPFAGTSTFQMMYQRVQEEPKSPKLLNPDLPDRLVRVILRCLARDPERRYQSAQEISRDLDAPRTPVRLFATPLSASRPGLRRWWAAAAAALAAMGLALAIPQVRNLIFHPRAPAVTGGMAKGIPSLTQGKYVAVLPFRVLGDKSSLGYIAEGLQDALSAKLFQLQGVHIASGEAVEKVSEGKPLGQIARELGANLIVEGTIQQAGGKIAIVANLHDVTSEKLVWSQEFPGVPDDLLTLEDQVYSQLVGALELKPGNEEMARAARRPTDNPQAYDDYLKGRDAMRGQQDAQSLQKAIDLYNAALQKDPNFALAYAGIADASLRMWDTKRDRFWADKAQHAALQAEQLNDQLPEVHFALGSVYNATGRVAEAVQELERAIQLQPNSDEGYRRLGFAYLQNGRKADAIQAYQKAVEIDQFYWANEEGLGEAYLDTGDYARALLAFRRVTDLEPNNPIGYEDVGAVYFRQGKYRDCLPQYQKALELDPSYDNYSNLGTAYFYLKRYNEAVTMFEKAVAASPNQQLAVGNLADAYRWSGQREKANATYDRAIALGFKDLQVNPRNAEVMNDMAVYYAKKGDSAQALKFVRSARSVNGDNVLYIYTEGVVQAIAGHTPEALKALEEAFRKGFPTSDAQNDPELKGLQGHAEFERLINQFGGKSQ